MLRMDGIKFPIQGVLLTFHHKEKYNKGKHQLCVTLNMPDTTIIIKQILTDSGSLDSINHKLAALHAYAERATTNPSISIWIPLFSSIVGGLLVWTGQAIERNRKGNLEKKNSLLEIYSYCRKLEALMKNNYRELAMAKTHVEYWWHCCNSTTSTSGDKPRYYEEHLKSQAFAREIEKRIGENKADFIGQVRKFQAIKPFDENVDHLLDTISNLTNAKAKSYDFSIPHQQLREELVYKDENELRETYYLNLKSFKTLNNTLQKFIER